ncbi:MAG: hypothetical protein HQL70_01365 [Magnetococcales bacterium]|nr:hypothetical protein [Magnetococcales bacterium]
MSVTYGKIQADDSTNCMDNNNYHNGPDGKNQIIVEGTVNALIMINNNYRFGSCACINGPTA